MRLHIVAAVLALLGFGGAAPASQPSAAQDASSGVLFLTIAASGGVGLMLEIRRLDAQGGTTVRATPERPLHKPDFVVEDVGPDNADLRTHGRWVAQTRAFGDAVSAELPAGRYVIDRIECEDGIEHQYWQTHYEFSVEAGKVTYLGAFLAVRSLWKGPFGITAHGCAATLKDRHERDLEFARQKGTDVTGAIISVPVR